MSIERDDDCDEGEWDESEDDGGDDDEPTIACPHCRLEIHEDSERCPHCEQYISDENLSSPRKPWWIIIGAALCLFVIYRWIVG